MTPTKFPRRTIPPVYLWPTLAIAATAFLLFSILHRSSRDVVLLEPFAVSKECERAGITPQTLREELLGAIQKIETFSPQRKVGSRGKNGEEAPPFLAEEIPFPDIEVAETKSSFGALVSSIDQFLGRGPVRMSGEIRKEEERFIVNLHLVDRRGGTPRNAEFVDSREALLPHMAESAVQMIHPYFSALYSFQSGKDQEAIEVARAIVSGRSEEAPMLAAASVLWGNVLARAGNLEEATIKYQQATEFYARSAAGYYNWGVALESRGKNDEAEKKYESAAQVASHKAPIFLALGELFEKEGKFDQAFDRYRDAANADRGFAEVYYRWGQLLEKRGKPEQALVKYGQMAEADPRFVGGYYATGHVLEKLYRRSEAETAYRKEIELDPTAEISYDALAGALEKEGKDREAEEFYKYWVSVMPKSFSAYRGWSDLLRKQGRTEEAKQKREQSDKFLFEQIGDH
jgi:tetratricopeptide (TPR) repeat protein